jgi:hypothetical protein
MSNSPRMQKRSVFMRAAGALILVALTATCGSPTAPSGNPIEPSQSRPEPSRNWPNLSGTYTLTLSASSRCASDLPEAVRTRAYTATIAQTGGALTVRLSGPGGLVWDWFPGAVGENGAVEFQLFIWEDLSGPAVEFVAQGNMTATLSAGGLSGLLDGRLYANGATCTAPDHGLVLSR